MAKYCKAYGLRVTYLDCLECEDKTCKKQRSVNMEEQENTRIADYVQNMEDVNIQKGGIEVALTKRYLNIEPEQKVFLVFASKKEGYKDNIVCRCRVISATVYSDRTIYNLKLEKIVLGSEKESDIKNWVQTFMCENANIDTGYRVNPNRYPVFTTKEKCIEWLKS